MGRNLFAGLLLAIGVLMAGRVAAGVPESPHLRVLGPREGLPATTVNALARDSAGFIWVGTTDGLARYDGRGFRLWRHDPRDSRSIPGNLVQALHVDGRDHLWVATEFSGVGRLDPQRGGFDVVRQETHPSLGSNDIFAFESVGDVLWMGTAMAGLYRMPTAGPPADWRPEAVPGLPSPTVLALARDGGAGLWVGTMAGLARWDGREIKTEPLPGEESAPLVYALKAHGGQLWAGTSAGVFRREADGRWLRLPWADMFERPNAVVSMAIDHDGALWLGSQRRLWRVKGDDGIPLPVEPDESVTPRYVAALLLQPDGGLWVGVPGKGLGYLRSDWRGLAQLRRLPDGSGLGGRIYRAATPARDGGVWIGGFDGHIERVDSRGVTARVDPDVRERLYMVKPLAMVEDSLGQLWISGNRPGLFRLDEEGRLDEWSPEHAEAPPTARVDLMVATGDGRLWLSAPGVGLQLRDAASGRVLRSIAADDASGLGQGDNEALRIGPDGRLWISGGFGLGWLDEARGRLVVPPALAGRRVFSFDFRGDGELWLHRLGGLEQFRLRDGAWRSAATVPAGDALPAVESGALRIDTRGRVWLSSQRGLFRWNPARGHLRTYGIANGLSSQEFTDRVLAMSGEGILVATTNDGGVVMVDTHFPDPPASVPVLRIDQIDVRRAGQWLDVPAAGDLRLEPNDRELRLVGHLLAYDDPESIRYWSLLEGFDRGWVEQGNGGERSFSGLPPGRYALRMRARDANGNAAHEQRLAFEIRPPWWRSTAAIASYALAALLALWASARAWKGRLRQRHEWLLAEQQRTLAEQASEAKTRFLATLGHEIRTPMTGVLGMAELLQAGPLEPRQRGQVDAILHAGRHLLRLVNDTLDLARIEADRLVLADEPFDLHRLVAQAADLLRPMAEGKGLAFRVAMAPDVPRWLRGDHTRVEQILLNLLGNAIKFTGEGEVALSVSALDGGGIACEVADTGPGLDDEQIERLFRRFEQAEGARTSARYGGSGLGLAISQELAVVMGGRIRVESAPGRGARFCVELPLEPASAPPSATPAAVAPLARNGARLLLVEDEPTVAIVIADLLRAQGHEVVHAAHGLAALTEVATGAFDAALLDLDLPGMDGFELARQLRGNGFGRPLVAVTARADADAEPMARAAGFDAFLRKPMTAAMLAGTLAKVMPARPD